MLAFGQWGSSCTRSAGAPPPSWCWNWPGRGRDGQALRWSATDPPRDDTLADLNVRGPHSLRHTSPYWLEDAGIPARVIDAYMGHAGGRTLEYGSRIGRVYRETTDEMEACA
jgi:integrase